MILRCRQTDRHVYLEVYECVGVAGELGEEGPDNNYFRNYKMVIKSALLIALFL